MKTITKIKIKKKIHKFLNNFRKTKYYTVFIKKENSVIEEVKLCARNIADCACMLERALFDKYNIRRITFNFKKYSKNLGYITFITTENDFYTIKIYFYCTATKSR